MAKVVVYRGRTRVLAQELRGREVVLGRLRSCHLQLEDRLVSRRHARFFLGDDGSWWVEDLLTPYGIWREDERIERAPLLPGDLLVVGQHLLLFEEGSLGPDEWEVANRARKRMTGPGTESTTTLPRVTVEHVVRKARLRAKCHLVADLGEGPEGVPLDGDWYSVGFRGGCDVRLRGRRLPGGPEALVIRDGRGRWFASALKGKTRLNGDPLEVAELHDRDVLEIGGRTVRFHEELIPSPRRLEKAEPPPEGWGDDADWAPDP